jgi:hypothetical protein
MKLRQWLKARLPGPTSSHVSAAKPTIMFPLLCRKPERMGREDYEGFLALARKADETALQAENQIARDSWHDIADEYRALASIALGVNEPDESPMNPS